MTLFSNVETVQRVPRNMVRSLESSPVEGVWLCWYANTLDQHRFPPRTTPFLRLTIRPFLLIPDVNSISADGVGFVFFYIQFTGAILEAFFCLGVGNGNKMYLGDSFSSAASSID